MVIQAQADVKSSVSWQKTLPVSVCRTHDIQVGRCDVASAGVRIRKPIAPSHHRTSPVHRVSDFLTSRENWVPLFTSCLTSSSSYFSNQICTVL